MREWSLSAGDPLYLTLAADARLSKTNYVNDHIWEVELGNPDPERSAVGINTTYGLRARSMRIFLRFSEGNSTITDPNTFAVKPSLKRFYPNFLTLDQPSRFSIHGAQMVGSLFKLFPRQELVSS